MKGKRSPVVLLPRNKRLLKRFSVITAVYLLCVFVMWLAYQNTVFSYVKRNSAEMMEYIGTNIAEALDDEFSRMKLATSTIAVSDYVRDFLTETDTTAYYERAGAVSEIVSKTVYPHMGEDTILTIRQDGNAYRFTGSVSDEGIRQLHGKITSGAATYSIVELDGTEFFCMVSPVYPDGDGSPCGYVVALSNLARIQRILTVPGRAAGIDTAVILDGAILISSNPKLDGRIAAEIEGLYGSVQVSGVSGGNLSVAAAITRDALHYGERLFFTVSAITLALLIITVAVLYRQLSAKVVRPTIKDADTMRMGLLKTQIDAHFVKNTVTCIKTLAEQGETEKIEIAAENLAAMLTNRHDANDEIGVFEQMEDIQRFLEIMNIRDSDKYITDFDVTGDLYRYCMLGQVLQPLVENAVAHGLKRKPRDCRLTVTGALREDCTVFEVADNGVGLPPSELKALQEVLDTADDWDSDSYPLKGVALINLQRRIRARYGAGFGLTLSATTGGGLTVTVRLPIVKETGSGE